MRFPTKLQSQKTNTILSSLFSVVRATAASLRRVYVCLLLYREIVDNHEKENALNIVTDERTYQVFAESPEDARWGGRKTATGYYLCLNRF